MKGFETPLVEDGGRALLWGCHAISLFLEALEPEDEERLERIHEYVASWLGSELRWSLASPFPAVREFDPSDFEMVTLRCRQLARPRDALVAKLKRGAVGRFFLAAHGGVRSNEPSPFSYTFFSEVPPGDGGTIFPTHSTLTLTVPAATPPAVMAERAMKIIAMSRCRWAAAGFGYGQWPYEQAVATHGAIYTHARRFWGFDVGIDAGWMPVFHDHLRTVNWLTFVGKPLLARAGEREVLSLRHPDVELTPTPSGLWLRAGNAPAACDINRLQGSPAYVAVDSVLRKVRASTGVHFAHPWSEKATEDWLRRFERRLS